jgi:hypothetical protein
VSVVSAVVLAATVRNLQIPGLPGGSKQVADSVADEFGCPAPG